jgi:hypothetical protein
MTSSVVIAAALATAASAWALDTQEIEREVNKKRDELSSCYDNAVTRNPELKTGKIVTRFRVNEDGKVTSAKIIRNDLGDTQLGECIRQVFLTLDYGEQGDTSNITYPLHFE